MHNNDAGRGGGGVRSWIQAPELRNKKLRSVNVALTQVKLQEKKPLKTSPRRRQEGTRTHTDDAVIHDELLNGTERKVKLWGSFGNLWFQVATATMLRLWYPEKEHVGREGEVRVNPRWHRLSSNWGLCVSARPPSPLWLQGPPLPPPHLP